MLWWMLACKPSDEVVVPGDWQTLEWQKVAVGWLAEDGADVWGVDGLGGLWDGDDGWARLDVPSFVPEDGFLRDVSAADGLVWALGSGSLAAFDGEEWDVVSLPAELPGADALVARADGSVVLVHSEQDTGDCYDSCETLVHTSVGVFDDGQWRVETEDLPGWIYAATETASGELVAVGAGIVARWDDPRWTVIDGELAASLWDVAADGDEIVAVGSLGTVLRGPLDALVAEGAGDRDLYAVDVGADGTAWAVTGLTYEDLSLWVDDGAGWTSAQLPSGSTWYGVLARDGAAWLAGDDAGPTVLEVTTVGAERLVHEAGMQGIGGASIDADGVAWLGGSGQVGRWSAGGFEVWTLPPPPSANAGPSGIVAVATHGADDVVAISFDDGIYAYDGSAWSLQWENAADDAFLWTGAMAPDGAAFAVGQRRMADETDVPLFLRREGGAWIEETAEVPVNTRSLFAVQAFAADEVYALTWGDEVAVLRWDGAAWSLVGGDLLPDGYEALWGRSGTDLYVGRSDATFPLLHWNGAAFIEAEGAPGFVLGIAGDEDALLLNATDGFGDDYAPVTYRYQDGGLKELIRQRGQMFVGSGAGDVLIVGDRQAWRGPLSSW